MQKPSIGRIVHVKWHGETLPAIITHVHSDTCVSVTVFGATYYVQGVRHTWPALAGSSLSYDEKLAIHETWAWPPRV